MNRCCARLPLRGQTAWAPHQRSNSLPARRRPAAGFRQCRPARPRGVGRRGGEARRCGVSVIEFAIVANVLFLTVFICIEFARLNMIRNMVQDAAYFAARTAMVPGATEQDAIAEAERILAILNTQGAAIEVNGGSAVTDDTQELRVRVTVPLRENALFTPAFTGNKEIEAIARMKTERYDGFFALD